MDITKDRLHELLTYESGELFWIDKKSNKNGSLSAGSKTPNGRTTLYIRGKNYFRSRIVWIMFNGEIPDGMRIDHRDTNPFNDRIENLRLATVTQNAYNAGKRKTNKSGYKGVSYLKKDKVWRATITAAGKQRYLGSFHSAEKAFAAYRVAATMLHGEFANTL